MNSPFVCKLEISRAIIPSLRMFGIIVPKEMHHHPIYCLPLLVGRGWNLVLVFSLASIILHNALQKYTRKQLSLSE